jgi:hypothetical protein
LGYPGCPRPFLSEILPIALISTEMNPKAKGEHIGCGVEATRKNLRMK